jgi:nucleoside-diphosphate-sugar epimerase
MKKKILILGGSSYLGSNLFYLLNKKYDVYLTRNACNKNNYNKSIYLKNKKKIININLNKKIELSNINFKTVINCIGNTRNYNKKNYNLRKSNYLLKKNLLFLNKLNFDVLLHISSSMIYGYSSKKFHENSTCKPRTKYAKFKYKEETLMSKVSNSKKKIIFLRLFSIFGKSNKKNSIYEMIKNNKKIIINNPNHQFDLISIKYFSQIIDKVILFKNKINNNEVINCCSGIGITPMYLLNLINKNTNISIKKNKKKTKQVGNNKKLLKLLKLKKFNLKNEIKYKYS